MELACDEAVACGQWDRVFQLLHDGLSPSEKVVEELCGNKMGERLAALYPDHTMTSGLRGPLLVGAVKHGHGDTALHVIHHQSVSDTEVMEAIRLAVHLHDKDTLLQLLTSSPRCRRVFKHKFHKEQWKEGAQGSECDDDSSLVGELGWIFDALCKHSEDDLAVHIAATKASKGETEFLQRFLTLKPKSSALTWRKLRITLGKLHNCNQPAFRDAVHALCDRSKDDVSRLFREVLRLGDVTLAQSLIDYGIQRKDLKFALPWIMLQDDPQCFVEVLSYFGRCFDLSNPGASRDDFNHAIMKPLKEEKYNFIKVASKKILTWLPPRRDSLIEVMIEAVLEIKAWVFLSSFTAVLEFGVHREHFLNRCLQEMLTDDATWQSCGTAFNLCLKEVYFCLGDMRRLVNLMRKKTLGEEWPVGVATLAQWCLAESHSNLAVLLGFVLADWQLVGAALSQPSLDLHESFLRLAVSQAIEEKAYPTGSALMKLWPMTVQHIFHLDVCIYSYKDRAKLAELCEEEGLHDWALVLSADHVSLLRDKVQACQSQVALAHLLKQATSQGEWDIVKELLVRIIDGPALFENVLLTAAQQGQLGVMELVMDRVDASSVAENYGYRPLMYWAADCRNKETSLEMARLCVASGLSTFQRQREVDFEQHPLTSHFHCPLHRSMELINVPVVRLILKSGALTNKRLHEERLEVESDFETLMDMRFLCIKTWKKGYRMIVAAAANPCRLEHMARLAVSHAISCRPGRQERIKGLPVPERIKDLIKFKDVLSSTEEEEEEEEEVVVHAGTLRSDFNASDIESDSLSSDPLGDTSDQWSAESELEEM
ncbi:uncharacterized protein [Littorina saxatilis]|uniref:uncharacterized protein n=1 Tax=Littorina saxatilis TaxID=31220 RepID=UPI0038B62190